MVSIAEFCELWLQLEASNGVDRSFCFLVKEKSAFVCLKVYQVCDIYELSSKLQSPLSLIDN